MKKLWLILTLLIASSGAWAQTATQPLCRYQSTPPALADQGQAVLQCDSAGNLKVGSGNPTSSTDAGITPVVSSAAEANHVLKASPGNVYGIRVTSGAAAGYVLLFDATAAPSNGAVTPVDCIVLPANSSMGISYNPPWVMATGITVSFSTTGCFTKTASATAFISGAVK